MNRYMEHAATRTASVLEKHNGDVYSANSELLIRYNALLKRVNDPWVRLVDEAVLHDTEEIVYLKWYLKR